ncbi:diphthine--ammonia ligase [Candidatus Woesearchaeota archaeon]|nr:diphthine--ammonia ligase [Candidatus Woesearchaeota archaeon]
MKLGVLFSGGKDSCAAMQKVRKAGQEVVCLLTMESDNPDSYMFHTPNINRAKLQAEAIGLPLITGKTPGEKEKELKELKLLIKKAKDEYDIEGITTGAVQSRYQTERIQNICDDLKLECINPLWQIDQEEYINWLIDEGFEMSIIGIAAYPLDEKWLGKIIDKDFLKDLKKLNEKYKISLAGEGGEFESFVTYAPGWKGRVVIDETETEYENHAGKWHIIKAHIDSI